MWHFLCICLWFIYLKTDRYYYFYFCCCLWCCLPILWEPLSVGKYHFLHDKLSSQPPRILLSKMSRSGCQSQKVFQFLFRALPCYLNPTLPRRKLKTFFTLLTSEGRINWWESEGGERREGKRREERSGGALTHWKWGQGQRRAVWHRPPWRTSIQAQTPWSPSTSTESPSSGHPRADYGNLEIFFSKEYVFVDVCLYSMANYATTPPRFSTNWLDNVLFTTLWF